MNTPGTASALPVSIPLQTRHLPRQSSGFSLVEVLITSLLISIGLLGMAALQGRATAYNSDAEHRATAAMLAQDLLELIRASPTTWKGYLDSGPRSPAPASLCTTTPGIASAQLACWLAEIGALLPQSNRPGASDSHVCRSPSPGQCDRTSSVIEVQVAWKSRHGECPNPASTLLCHYRLRGEI